MDKQKYGESIVNQIIDAYKKSKEFQDDAVKFVKKEIINEIHALNVKAYYELNNNIITDENNNVSKAWADELCFNVEVTKQRLQNLNELFDLTFNEGEHARP